MSGAETSSTGVRDHLAALLLGLALAAAAVAGGALAVIGIAPALLVATLLGGAALWWARRRGPHAEQAGPAGPALAACLLLAGAIAAGAVALTMGYLPAARSLTYAVADLGAAFFLGALAALSIWRRAARLPGAPVAAALAVIAVCMVNAFSFYAYPALVISGSAVLQTSAYLLTPGRVFPFYVLAFVLGIPLGLLCVGRRTGRPRAIVWLAAVGAALAADLLGQLSYVGPYALAVGLALAAAVVAWAGGPRGSLVLRVVTVGAGAFGLVWLAVGDPHMQRAGLRLTLGNILHRAGPAGRVVDVQRTPDGWHVALLDGDVSAQFENGNLMTFRQPGLPEQNRASFVMTALCEAYAPAWRKVTGPLRPSELLRLPERGASGYPLILCHTGFLGGRDPLALISREGLERERARLAPDGVLALGLPAGNLHVDDLRRALATIGAAFPHYDVYLEGRQAVIFAGDKLEVSYARLARLFEEQPDADGEFSTKAMLADAGFAEPMDALVGFVGSEKDLAELTDGVQPWSTWSPARPPAMALDLAEPARPAAVLALAQYRMLGAGRLVERLRFESPAQKMVALRGFGPIYANRTERALSGLGLAGAERRGELLRFLTGPLARLDLLAPQQKGQEARVAVALSLLGLRDAGAAVLRSAIKAGKDDFEVNVELAGILVAQAQKGDALKHFRRALELEPESVPVRGRMVALLLGMGQEAEAADVLKEIVQRQPDSVATLLQLGYVCAKLKRYDEAADAAQRVLRIEPNNADAQALLALCRPAIAKPAEPAE